MNGHFSQGILQYPVADPGFSRRGGHGPHRGPWTPEAAIFHKIYMSKRKNWDPWGATRRVRSLDPPMISL